MFRNRSGASSKIKRWLADHGKGKGKPAKTETEKPGAVSTRASRRAKKEEEKKAAAGGAKE